MPNATPRIFVIALTLGAAVGLSACTPGTTAGAAAPAAGVMASAFPDTAGVIDAGGTAAPTTGVTDEPALPTPGTTDAAGTPDPVPGGSAAATSDPALDPSVPTSLDPTCSTVGMAMGGVSAQLLQLSGDSDTTAMLAQLADISKQAPAELQPNFQALSDAVKKYSTPGHAGTSPFMDPDVQNALDGIDQWIKKHC